MVSSSREDLPAPTAAMAPNGTREDAHELRPHPKTSCRELALFTGCLLYTSVTTTILSFMALSSVGHSAAGSVAEMIRALAPLLMSAWMIGI